MAEEKTQDLGYANGWTKKVPDVVQACKKKLHQVEQKTVGRCLTKYTCEKCNYTYMIDSGD